ncbi:hypothetical protein DPMN_062076 [Dreissena polymorpha]|uniref:Uncharacterized protein n=1 Tax=Dreissena polymorpha TaxID=45954 RepID=A0A9D4C8V8_DREPO|nr:hypothetical protein DPMN_062076 [Dreissena polymorpha]
MALRIEQLKPIANLRYKGTDLLSNKCPTKFHAELNSPYPGGYVFFNRQLLKNAPPPGGHVFQPTRTIFKLTIHVASRVLRKNARPIEAMKNAPPPGGHVFQPIILIFEQLQDIIGINLLTKFHEDRTMNVASRVLTRFNYSHKKICPPPGGHVFQATVTIFELVQDIVQSKVLTTFHEDWTINVTSIVLTRQMLTSYDARRTPDKKRSQKLTMSKYCSGTDLFRAAQYIIRTNVLTKFHEERTIHVNFRVLTSVYYGHIRITSPPHGGHGFQHSGTISELIQEIIKTNGLTNRTINVASRMLTRFYNSHIWKNAPAPLTIFELVQDIIETNLLTKVNEDRTINVASRVLTRFNYGHIGKNARPLAF